MSKMIEIPCSICSRTAKIVASTDPYRTVAHRSCAEKQKAIARARARVQASALRGLAAILEETHEPLDQKLAFDIEQLVISRLDPNRTISIVVGMDPELVDG